MVKVLVIGSGIAGLSAAIKASKSADVILVTKGKSKDSNSFEALGGLAAVFSKDDSYILHIKDTMRAGDGLCNRKSVEQLVLNAPNEVKWLEKQGVKFDKTNHDFSFGREAVHSRSRIVHSGDNTGENVMEKLISKLKIKVLEDHMVIDLLAFKNKCYGALVLGKKLENIYADFTILATGGIGQLWKHTCNPTIATGDGIAIAFRAGANVEDLEFMQFHPTALFGSKPSLLISETLRGEGAVLLNKFGKTFMQKYHRDGEMAPRDVVSKFSIDEMKRTNSDHLYLDISFKDPGYLKKRFPHVYKKCLKYGIDLTKTPIPVSPTAHYMCGGVKIDLEGRTNIKNLYAIGEVSCSGLHGADRLASNSLTDGLVFGTKAVESIKKEINKQYSIKKIEKTNKQIINLNQLIINKKISKKNNYKKSKIKKLKSKIQDIMWEHVGIIRTTKGLKRAFDQINEIEKKLPKNVISKELAELKNLVLNAKLMIKFALNRKESRGTHFLRDFPTRDDKKWRKHFVTNRKLMKY